MKLSLVFLISVFVLPWPGFAKGIDLAERLTALEENYRNVKTIKGHFEQTFKSVRFPERTADGEMFFEKPNRMRWNYSDPKGKTFLLDGANLFLFDPQDEQVLKAKQPRKNDLPLALALLSGRTKVRDHFICEWQDAGEIKRDSAIECSPKEDIPNVALVILQLTDADAPTIRRSVIVDSLGNHNELVFENLELNPNLPKDVFNFEVPKGVPTVEMDVGDISLQ